jgi:phosphoribosylformylglycinamidine synthase subunit PurSL
VQAIADLSVEIGVPFISGKDSSAGSFEAAGRAIDVPATLAVAVLGRVPDVKGIVTKEFKRPGNKLVLAGRSDADALGGSVYADAHGQRGDSLFDAGDKVSVRSVWATLLALGRQRRYVSGSAIAEGGLLLRLFEACLGSGLGASVDLNASYQFALGDGQKAVRGEGLLFGEFVGSALIEVAPEDLEEMLGDIPYRVVGEVLEDSRLELIENGGLVWQDRISALDRIWSKTFREVLE